MFWLLIIFLVKNFIQNDLKNKLLSIVQKNKSNLKFKNKFKLSLNVKYLKKIFKYICCFLLLKSLQSF